MSERPEHLASGEAESSHEAEALSAACWDDLELGFSDSTRTKLDERGRLKMPVEFRNFLDKKYGKGFNAFYITSRDGQTAELYPMPEWKKRQAKIFAMPPSNPARKKLLAADNLYGGRADMDPQGRLLLTEELRNQGILAGDVKVSGEGNLLRVTSLQKLRESVLAQPIGADDEDLLASFGL